MPCAFYFDVWATLIVWVTLSPCLAGPNPHSPSSSAALLNSYGTWHHHRLASLDQPWLLRHLQSFADAIHDKGAPLEHCFGFIDGKVCPICRPTLHQRVVYNGHKLIHSLKFQSVMTPNGMIANLFGPVEGRRHDNAVLRMSGLMAELEHRQMRDRAGRAMAVYGNPAYPLREYLQCPFKGANITPGQQDFNSQMASARECVEWEFGKMLRIFRKNLKIFLSPVAKYYLVGGFLTNCHTFLYGNQTYIYFRKYWLTFYL